MKRSLSSRFAAAAVFAAAALGAVTAAQAHTDVFFTIGVPARSVYVEPQPVYVQPQPIYVQPRPIYVQPGVQPVYGYERYERPWQPSYEAQFEREGAWRHTEWRHRKWARRHHHDRDDPRSHGWDRDRD